MNGKSGFQFQPFEEYELLDELEAGQLEFLDRETSYELIGEVNPRNIGTIPGPGRQPTTRIPRPNINRPRPSASSNRLPGSGGLNTSRTGQSGGAAFTRNDVIDERIDVFAQYSLLRMFKGDAAARSDGEGMLAAVKTGQLAGIYKEDERVPAMRAKSINLGWWQLIPKGEDAALVDDPKDPRNGAPIIVFRDSVRSTPTRIDPALRKAWRSFLLRKTGPAGNVCELKIAHPIDVVPSPDLQSVRGQQFRPVSAQRDAASDQAMILKAFRDSRVSLRRARNALASLLSGFQLERQGGSLNPFQKRVLISVGRWLKVDTSKNTTARTNAAGIITRAIGLIDRNLVVKTSAGQDPPLSRVNDNNLGLSFVGVPDRGVTFGNPFFDFAGPNCRRDVMTHEFFHLVGVNHGANPLTARDVRGNNSTPALALDSADNLAQLVSELMDGKSDACARRNV